MVFFRHGSGACCFVTLCLSINPMQAASSDFAENSPRIAADVFSQYDGAKAILGTGVFAPLFSQDGSILFLDASLSAAENDFHTASIGVGYRVQRAWGVLGLNAFFDAGQTEFSGVRNQIGLGAEFASGRFRLGVNGYLPLDDREAALGAASARIIGNELRLFGGEEHFLKGIDLEFGVLAAGFTMDSLTAEIWANGKLESFHSDVLGVQNSASIGLEAVVHPTALGFDRSTLKLQAAAQWDEQTDDLALAVGFKVSVALGAVGFDTNMVRDAETDVLTNRVRRRHGIKTVAAATGPSELTFDHDTNVALNTVQQVNSQADLVSAVAGSNNLVVVDAGTGPYARINLTSNSTIMGGGSTIEVRGRTTGQVVSFTADGSRPTITIGPFSGQAMGAGISPQGIHIAGFEFIGSGGTNLFAPSAGIGFGSGARNIVIDHNSFFNTTFAIGFGPFGSDIVIRDNTIDTSMLGLNMGSNLGNVSIVGNRFGNIYSFFNSFGFAMTFASHTGNSQAAPINISDNEFYGVIPFAIFNLTGSGYDFAGAGNTSTALGNGNNPVTLCSKSGIANFTGSVLFDIGVARDTPLDCP